MKKVTNSPPKSKFGDSDEDEDGVKGFTLRLTQVQVSEEKKKSNLTSSAKKTKYGSSSHYRNGSMVGYAEHEIEDEAAYTEFAIQTRVNTIVGANGGFTIKSSNNKRKIINVIGSPSHHHKGNSSQIRGTAATGNSSSIRSSINHPLNIQGFEERKTNEGNDIEMMSIGSNLRLEHLEEQPLRTKKVGSAAKPPKFSQKILKQATNLSGTIGSVSSGADDSTTGSHTDHSQSDSGQELNQSLSSSMGSNGPLTNQMLKSPAKKKTLFTNSKLIVQLTKDGSPVKREAQLNASPAKEQVYNSHKKRAEEIKDFKRSLCYKALE